jgi:prepilin-type N-terminal cleavage/methylation domain-containing protein
MWKTKQPAGFSLAELLIVIVILGVVAKVAIPNLSSGDEAKLDVAAGEIIQALRFARSEAIRQGTCIEVNIEPDGTVPVAGMPTPTTATANRVQVTRWSDCGLLPTATTMIHPIDKKDYLYFTGKTPNTAGVSTRATTLNPQSSLQPYRIFFYSDGSPRGWGIVGYVGPFPIYSYVPLVSGSITLTYGKKARVIAVNPAGKIS